MNLKINKTLIEDLNLLDFFNSKHVKDNFNLKIINDNNFYYIDFLDESNIRLTEDEHFKASKLLLNKMKEYFTKNISLEMQPCKETYDIASRMSKDMEKEGYYRNEYGRWGRKKLSDVPIAYEIHTTEDGIEIYK